MPGASETALLHSKGVREMIDSGMLWRKLKRFFKFHYILTCIHEYDAEAHGGGDASGEEERMAHCGGLLDNRAYTMLCVKEVGALKFVRLRACELKGECAARRHGCRSGSLIGHGKNCRM